MASKNSSQTRIKLPTTVKEYEELVDKVVKKHKLQDKHHAAAIISVAIRHLPVTEAYTTLDYLGHYVIKNIANFIADHQAKVLRHESEIDQLANILTNDPNDGQARDALVKAKNEGSIYAAAALDKLEPNAIAG